MNYNKAKFEGYRMAVKDAEDKSKKDDDNLAVLKKIYQHRHRPEENIDREK